MAQFPEAQTHHLIAMQDVSGEGVRKAAIHGEEGEAQKVRFHAVKD